jgi:hypothetical protein
VLGNHICGAAEKAADVDGKHVRGAVKQGTGVLGAVYAGVAGLGGAVAALFKVRALAQLPPYRLTRRSSQGG